ncbi:MAG: 4Fe-4S dicluster domain-containing protein [Candidatus Atabeyarchaeum deiterrae]|jgi:NAD-dependent dihydropyrimidine dehydrogenase PreA subunit
MPKVNVDNDKCTGCGTCVDVCPQTVFELDNEAGKTKVINEGECLACRACESQCENQAINIEE